MNTDTIRQQLEALASQLDRLATDHARNLRDPAPEWLRGSDSGKLAAYLHARRLVEELAAGFPRLARPRLATSRRREQRGPAPSRRRPFPSQRSNRPCGES